MPILQQPAHTFKTEDTFVAAQIELGTLVLADTRNEEAAADGNYSRLITVIPLQEAIAIAKAVLAVEEDVAYDAWIEQQYQRYLDYQALVDDALAHEVAF